MTAKYGIYYDNLNKVFLRDSVMVINKEGDTLRTPELWWDSELRKNFILTNLQDSMERINTFTGTQGLDATQDLESNSIQISYRSFRYKRRKYALQFLMFIPISFSKSIDQ